MLPPDPSPAPPAPRTNSPGRVLVASLVGTTIEFFDFYIYATAAVLVFPKLFFPGSDPAVATLESLATFALAFFARPLGSALFGHFGDRHGRKATLVAALVTMGCSTVAIGCLPTYGAIGRLAPLLLAACRLGQGLGLGGEWGGAVLLAIENAPPAKRAWFGMFPQLGAPLGFLLSGGTFYVLSTVLSDDQFLRFGWRIPFLASSVLVFVGLYVRLKISETPAFRRAIERHERVRVPMVTLARRHFRDVAIGTAMALVTFLIFYLLTVFCLSWGTTRLGFTRPQFLLIQMTGMVFLAAFIPCSALLADRYGRRITLMLVTAGIVVYGLVFAPLFEAGVGGVLAGMILGLSLMGLSYGALGTALSELFPTAVRYSGASISFNLAGIFGAALAPWLAMWLAQHYGLPAVGCYLSGAALVSLLAFGLGRETRGECFAGETAAGEPGTPTVTCTH
ncbi:MAG: MFS transporter [Opitutales bacterium]